MKRDMLPVWLVIFLTGAIAFSCSPAEQGSRADKTLFTNDWQFSRIDSTDNPLTFDQSMQDVQLPHDWSIEGPFSEDHPAGYNGGALPGGLGLYRKEFQLPDADSSMLFFIYFDGVYMNSEVWINGHYLGKRPSGYISFSYEMSPHLKFGEEKNVLLVKVDNSRQPNSRWYSGSGIYRNVYLVKKDHLHIDQWGVFATTPQISAEEAVVAVETSVTNRSDAAVEVKLLQHILEQEDDLARNDTTILLGAGESTTLRQELVVAGPHFWSLEDPHLYQLQTELRAGDALLDRQITPLGIRTLAFDMERGFLLNGETVKIKGVCNHHDLGPLGTAVNKSAIERQLDILAGMGVNAIRTAHNPPAPELLQLCDEKGFLVMDEAFDEWKITKVTYGYGQYWDEWHERDLVDFMKRDRNHPSIVIWSIGNEIMEQWDSTGIEMTREVAAMARSLDTSRPITTGNNPPLPHNFLNVPDVLDVIGYNYAHTSYEKHYESFPNRPFVATETTSALATRGYYDERSDTTKRWPVRWDLPFTDGNEGNTVSAYDQVSTPWGSTHEESWKVIKKQDWLSGMFIWTGFDYLGEPTPYTWPSRSSYFGVIDLAGFPKDSYYMYRSEWTDEAVLHIFPHWTWEDREEVDIWAYYSQADEVELFLNDRSLGRRQKEGDELHVMWRVPYEAGELKAVSYLNGEEVLTKTIRTAGEAAAIQLETDRETLTFAEQELAFITVSIVDEAGTLVPDATNTVTFQVEGAGKLRAVGNGDPTSHASFQANERQAFYGKCLLIVEPTAAEGEIIIRATAGDLSSNEIKLVPR